MADQIWAWAREDPMPSPLLQSGKWEGTRRARRLEREAGQVRAGRAGSRAGREQQCEAGRGTSLAGGRSGRSGRIGLVSMSRGLMSEP